MAQLRTRRRVMWQGLVLFLFFGWSDIGRGGSEAHSDLCFAFLRLGNIVLHCTGDQQQVTKSRNIESFAVSDKPGTLGFVTTRAARQTSAPTATLVDLTNGNARNVLSDGTLLSTCGGLFDLLDRPHERSGTIDLVGGGTFAPPFAAARIVRLSREPRKRERPTYTYSSLEKRGGSDTGLLPTRSALVLPELTLHMQAIPHRCAWPRPRAVFRVHLPIRRRLSTISSQ